MVFDGEHATYGRQAHEEPVGLHDADDEEGNRSEPVCHESDGGCGHTECESADQWVARPAICFSGRANHAVEQKYVGCYADEARLENDAGVLAVEDGFP